MFNQLLNAITGSATSSTYSLPAGNGIKGIPLASTFKNFFNSVINSITPMPTPGALGANFGGGGIGGSMNPMGGLGIGSQGIGLGTPGLSMGALQAYQNSQTQFARNPQQFFGGQVNKHPRAQAFSPGAVLTNGFSGTAIPPQFNQAAFNPLQGFAGQGGVINGFPQGQSNGFAPVPYGMPGQFPGGAGFTQGGFGKLQLFLGPLIGIFTIFKSIFDIKRTVSSLQPVKVNRNDTNLYGIQEEYIAANKQDGSFEEYFPEDNENDHSSDFAKLNTY